MPTIIDSLVVSLGLDTKAFTKEQRDALGHLRKFEEESVRSAKRSEEGAQRQLAFMSRIKREAVTLFATLAGGYGIKQLIGNLVSGDAAMGRFARSTGVAVAEVAKFDKAIELAGGTPGSGKGALSALNDQVQAFRAGLGGQILPLYNQMAAEGGHIIDINGEIIDQIVAIAKNAEAIERKTKGRGGFFLRQLGFDENAINVLIRGGPFLQQLLSRAEKLGSANKEAADASEKLLSSWRETGQLINGLIRPLTIVADKTLEMVNSLLKLAAKNQETFYSVPEGDREGLRNERINSALGISADQQSSAQKWFANSWIGRMLGVKPYKEEFKPVPNEGGIFGGMGWKPMGWDSGDLPRFGAEGGSSSSTSTTINVNGPITVNTKATDAQGVAAGLKGALTTTTRTRQLASQANSGQE